MTTEQAAELIRKYNEGTASADEIKLVDNWFKAESAKREADPIVLNYDDVKERVWSNVASQLPIQTKRVAIWPRIAVAASLLFFLSVGGYFLLNKQPTAQLQTAKTPKVDIAPGNQAAILQLSNGKQISLNQVKAGHIATQANTSIVKTADNKIVYNATAPSKELVYNTITTKRGNFYPLTLSDGTIAILDAGSSITYPVAFTGNERKVEITGQVYFEVTHNAQMPFRVSVKGQIIEDLGTQFNINAYDDEPNIKATLIEGSINVNHEKTLVPGQQAVIKDGQIKINKNADIEQAIAWKNGLFKFNDTQISDVMRQLSRWYDVDIEYPDGVPHTVFNGKMQRNTNASQVLDILSFAKIHFQIVQGSTGKKILVRP